MKINEYHQKYRKVTGSSNEPEYVRCSLPRVVCKDGFVMSVQASSYHYSQPKDLVDEYLEFEIGFPNQEEPLIMSYCEDTDKPCDTVYGYVPTEIVEQVIDKHGGFDFDAIRTLNKSTQEDCRADQPGSGYY